MIFTFPSSRQYPDLSIARYERWVVSNKKLGTLSAINRTELSAGFVADRSRRLARFV